MTFHVSPEELAIGLELEPGSWGRKIRTLRSGAAQIKEHSVFLWEMALEAARLSTDPALTSRLDCTFLTEELEHAVSFRDQFRPNGFVYRVRCLDDVRVHRGDYSLLTHQGDDRPLIDWFPDASKKYWTEEPKGNVELLYPGRIRIEEAVGADHRS
ncbi:hypothetical protein MRS76_11305 [Rhizobiaceae bacterium n13]|uniref:hypothetical protein n=1 Tax=Ferirhizobium litorale TaxID=2927786 RepID=UPI0024B28EAA|nr:hypothetical protein [Fererhizobium litorale]MDI7862548.1 hypothetical protein [Fererhizobium litorale]